ncbi:DsbA family protein [Wolbachia endosymbiont of Chironomus riparius]|uniref:DsbA family protein n=1 Tax=Wolbachia endosymbiont of Chironomus riparius TaxID=2883238 RepID=UPI00209D24CA|nr:DsbA family protein [Wolbachia endosymbiont of Chironomus riparius]
MIKISFFLTFIIFIASLPFIGDFLANLKQPKNIALSDDYIGQKLDDYINNNIEKIIKNIQDKSKYAAQDKLIKNKILQYKDEIFDTSYPSTGNIDSKVIAVGFFDYSCGYCKVIKDDIKQLINDGKINYIFRDSPILGNNSLKMAKSALAVYFIKKEKYFDFNYAALSHTGEFSDNDILNILQNIGIEESEFNNSMQNNMNKIEHMINSSKALVRDLGIGGTPFLIIGDSIFVGATDLSILREKVNQLMNSNS